MKVKNIYKITIFVITICFGNAAFSQNIREATNVIIDAVNKTGIPSISAAVYKDNMLVFSGAYGIKDITKNDSVSAKDFYHVGSIGKSMTATWAAYYVEKDTISWDTKIIDVFPELDSLKSIYTNSRLIGLLSNSTGIVDLFNAEDWRSMEYSLNDIGKQRKKLMLKALVNKDNLKFGKEWAYANINFTIAALMIEEKINESWENSFSDFWYNQLGIKVGYGWPRDKEGKIAPKGHVKLDGKYEKWGPSHPHQVPITIRPAGDVYMSIIDLAKYGDYHLKGLKKGNKSISKENFEILHTPILENYALGWNIIKEGTPSIPNVEQHQHLGSGGTFKAILAIFPSEDLSIAIVHNGGGNITSLSSVLTGLTKIYSTK